MNREWRFFCLAVAGSAAIESLKIVRAYESGRPLPARYMRFGFWTFRVVLACAAGVLATATGNQSEYLAFYIGASFPAFLENASHNVEPPRNGSS